MPKHDEHEQTPSPSVNQHDLWELTAAGHAYARGDVNDLSQTLIVIDSAPSVSLARDFIGRDLGFIEADPEVIGSQVYMMQNLEHIVAQLQRLGYLRPK